MSIKESKQRIMGLAAVLIVIFHLIPLPRGTGTATEFIRFLASTAYIGVDIFFFLSGYMIYFSNTDDYAGYLKRKFRRIYPLFIFSCIIFAASGKITPVRALLTLTGADLFVKGGGSFLWFLPAVMIIYITAPLYIRLKRKIGNITALCLGITVWVLAMILLEKSIANHAGNIFLCRIPIVLVGMTMAEYEGIWKKKMKIAAGMLLLTFGVILSWKYCGTVRVEQPITNIFYVITMPECLGLILLTDAAAVSLKKSLLGFFGKITLELYCVQMMCGSFLFGYAFSLSKSKTAAFVIAFAIVVVISVILKKAGRIFENRKSYPSL